jgi:hypothetical protein
MLMPDNSPQSNNPEYPCYDGCDVTAHQNASVCVPVSITPDASAGDISIVCTGPPTITPLLDEPTYQTENNRASSCHYILKQNFSVEIPIHICAEAYIGNPSIECGKPDSE